jgi:predicted ATP-grasp superfamily ATP-dependent carboligase
MIRLATTPQRSALGVETRIPTARPATVNRTPHVLVTDCGRGSAVAMIRSFRRRGWRVVAGDSDPHNVRFRSRDVAQPFHYPAPRVTPNGFVDSVLSAVQRWDVELVVPITDEALLPLSQARHRFPQSCRLAIPEAQSLELTTNKQKTLELATQLQIPVPATATVTTVDEALQASELFQWPIVIKPLVSRLYRDGQPIQALTVSYADCPAALARQMKEFDGRCSVLLQEYVAGEGHGVELLAHEGRTLAAFQHRRLREVPVTGGASSLRESAPLDPQLFDFSQRLLDALRWTGLAMVEFKVGKDGPRLMEINGRVWGSLPLAVHSGMDFPVRLAELYLQGPPLRNSVPATDYRVGVRSRNLELDVVWMLSVMAGRKRYTYLPTPSRRSGLAALFDLLNPAIHFDILSWRDPLPGVGELLRIARKLVTKSRS